MNKTSVSGSSESSSLEINDPPLLCSLFCSGCGAEEIKNQLVLQQVVLVLGWTLQTTADKVCFLWVSGVKSTRTQNVFVQHLWNKASYQYIWYLSDLNWNSDCFCIHVYLFFNLPLGQIWPIHNLHSQILFFYVRLPQDLHSLPILGHVQTSPWLCYKEHWPTQSLLKLWRWQTTKAREQRMEVRSLSESLKETPAWKNFRKWWLIFETVLSAWMIFIFRCCGPALVRPLKVVLKGERKVMSTDDQQQRKTRGYWLKDRLKDTFTHTHTLYTNVCFHPWRSLTFAADIKTVNTVSAGWLFLFRRWDTRNCLTRLPVLALFFLNPSVIFGRFS